MCELTKRVDNYTWLKDGLPLISNKDVEFSVKDNQYSITIKNVRKDDVGRYKFSIGQVSTEATVTIEGIYFLVYGYNDL